jgi:hypothetical protein
MNNPADFLSNIARAGLGVAPLTTRACVATGNHRVAQNDEPEPLFSEAQLIEADKARDPNAARAAREQALHWQQRDVADFVGRGS